VMSHDEQEWLPLVDDVVFLRKGRVVYAGQTHETTQLKVGFTQAGLIMPASVDEDGEDNQGASQVVEVMEHDHKRGHQSLNAFSRSKELLKLVLVIAASVLLLSLPTLELTVAYTVAALGLFVASGVRLRDVIGVLKALTVVLVLAWVASAVVVDGSGDLVSLGYAGLSSRGIHQGFMVVLRIVSLTSLVAAYANTTTPSRLAKALLAPLEALGVRGKAVSTLSTTVMLTLRSIPYAAELFRRIEAAQLVRKAPLQRGPLRTRLGAWVAVLVPALVALMHHGDHLALALKGRGFEAEIKPTKGNA